MHEVTNLSFAKPTLSQLLLLIVVVKYNRCILFLNLRCETVLMIVPKQVENTLVRDGLWIVVQLNCLGVIATIKRQCVDFLDFQA